MTSAKLLPADAGHHLLQLAVCLPAAGVPGCNVKEKATDNENELETISSASRHTSNGGIRLVVDVVRAEAFSM